MRSRKRPAAGARSKPPRHAYSLLDLPESALDTLCFWITQMPNGYARFMHFASCSRQMQALLLMPSASPSKSLQPDLPAGCSSMEQLAVHEALLNIGTNRIYFHPASTRLIPSSELVVEEFAKILLRHPRLTARLDGLCGPTAPGREIAFQTSRSRAFRVHGVLSALGVKQERLDVVSWGARVAFAAQWPVWSNPEYARVELFVKLDGIEFPLRSPDYARVQDESDRSSSSSESSDTDTDEYSDMQPILEDEQVQMPFLIDRPSPAG